MDYRTARRLIQSGDILGVRGNNVMAKFTRLAQRIAGFDDAASITHCGVAWWDDGRLYSAEMDGKHNVLRPLSQHIDAGCAVDVFACPVAPSAVATQFDHAMSEPIAYGLLDLLRIGLRLVFGVPTGGEGDNDLVCSTFAARWLAWAGWFAPSDLPTMPSPAELCAALGTLKLKIESKA